ncbi:MAG: hypothetical protein J6Z38_02505 [Lachnospiraceae bacterium]|nr:hypothetical protein [Lachnospiraceae bacterium]
MGLFDKIMAGAGKNAEEKTGLSGAWTKDRVVTLDGMPETLEELKAAVDVKDPGSVAAYWVYSVMALTGDYETGIGMMKYLFADLEPFGRGFTEGGNRGLAGWNTAFNERLTDDEYRWLPRAYFCGAAAANGFKPAVPLAVELHYNAPLTEAANSQSLVQQGRLNIVYWVRSNAAGCQVNLVLAKFEGSDRWYVTSGASSSELFYDQRAGLTAEAKAKLYE